MFNKILKSTISVVLAFVMCFVTCTAAFAATSNKNSYIKEVFLSYGKTDSEAKSYLKDNDYEVLDYNLNEGADDTLSTKRAVYLGYKTTSNADEAITDMKLMNMKGGYSVQDYQMLLEEQKTNIKSFINNFIVAVNEYRNNYNDGQERAVAAYDMLNTLYEDDTKQYMGDLLLNKIKEEYPDKEWNALSSDEQSKIADMTTILMQGNADAILLIEQIISTATDDGDNLWAERYSDAMTYEEMVENLMDTENLTMNDAVKQLSAEYDKDAKIIASKFDEYKTFLENYTNADVKFTNTEEEIETYRDSLDDTELANWFAAGTQYETLSTMVNDDVSLLDLITSDEYDIENDDRTMLYPLVSVLTKGQRVCLDFLTMYQIVSLGLNGDEATKSVMENTDIFSSEDLKTSVYEGVDRTIFSGNVALTNEALRLQASSGKNAIQSAEDSISTTTLILYCVFGVSVLATAASFATYSYLEYSMAKFQYFKYVLYPKDKIDDLYSHMNYIATFKGTTDKSYIAAHNELVKIDKVSRSAWKTNKFATKWNEYFYYAGIVMTCVSIAIMIVSLYSTYCDLKEYYNVDFTPIPTHMVDQSTDENGEKVYTYYNPVKCNRIENNMVTDNNKLLEDYGDLNGDVGKQWIALYTTTDKSAGDPITTDFVVQYNDSNIPNNTIALSMFGESVAQNLTNKKSGYTYSDGKNGIYLFYGTDTNAFAGSVFSNGGYIALGVAAALVCCIGAFFAGKKTEKKKHSREMNVNA